MNAFSGGNETVWSINAWSENNGRIAIQNWIDRSHENGYTFRNRITTIQEILNAENYDRFAWNDCQLPPRSSSKTCSPTNRQMNQEIKEQSRVSKQVQESSEIMTENCFIPEKFEVKNGIRTIKMRRC